MTQNKKHTALPWELGSNLSGDEYSCNILAGEYKGIIAKTELSQYFHYEESEANAALIVTAVNNHYSLLEALKACESYMHDLQADNIHDPNAGIFYDKDLENSFTNLRAAIKNAENNNH